MDPFFLDIGPRSGAAAAAAEVGASTAAGFDALQPMIVARVVVINALVVRGNAALAS